MTTATLPAILVAATLAFGSAAHGASVLKLAHEDPPDGLRHQAARMFAERVAATTDGRYTVDVHHSATLGSGPKLVELLKLGAIDFATTGTAIFASQVPELSLLALPYLIESYEQGWQLYDNSLWVKEWFGRMPAKGLRILAMWEAGFRQVTAKKPINGLDDLKGMKIRIAQNQVYLWLWSAFGANPTVIPFGETYIALQQGVVDAQENPIPTIHVSKFYEVAKYVALTNHIYAPIPLGINERRYQSLSAVDRTAIESAARMASAWHRKAVVDEEEAQLADMRTKGATVQKPDLAPFAAASRSVIDRASDKFPRAVVDDLLKEAAAVKARHPTK
jgi:tripartite ATP-independent transporter DctP family solute receptor